MTLLLHDADDFGFEADDEVFLDGEEPLPMWGEVGEDDEEWDEDPYPALREVLAAEYRYLPPEAIEGLFESVGLSADDVEFDFGKALRSVGQAAAGLAPTVLPIAGTALGTVFGGPVGAAVGGSLGRLAGGAIGAAVPQRGTLRGPPGAPVVARPASPTGLLARPPLPGGSPAAATLVNLLSRPEVLQALQAMALGTLGTRNVPVAGTPVPTGAFANLLGTLAARATSEHHVVAAGDAEGVPLYLMDEAGEPAVDVTLPEERAARLLELLEAAEQYEALDRGWAEYDEAEPGFFELDEDAE